MFPQVSWNELWNIHLNFHGQQVYERGSLLIMFGVYLWLLPPSHQRVVGGGSSLSQWHSEL